MESECLSQYTILCNSVANLWCSVILPVNVLYRIPPGVELNCSEGVLPAGGQCTLIVTIKPWQRAHSLVAIKYRVVLQEEKEGGE